MNWYWWILALVGFKTHSQARAFSQPTRANIHQYQFNNPIIFCKYPATINRCDTCVWYIAFSIRIVLSNIFYFLNKPTKYQSVSLYFPILLANVSFISKCLGIRFPIGNIGVLCIVTLVHIQLKILKNSYDYFLVKIISGKVTKCAKLFGY